MSRATPNRRVRIGIVMAQLTLLAACAHTERKGTLSSLHAVKPDTHDVHVDRGLEKAMESYRRFLQESPASALTPEAMRRLADLQLEKEYGVHGSTDIVVDRVPSATQVAAASAPATNAKANTALGDGKNVQLAAPTTAKIAATDSIAKRKSTATNAIDEQQLEQSASSTRIASADTSDVAKADGGPEESIKLYDQLLEKFPNYAFRDQVLYQKARALDELGRTDEAMAVMEQLVRQDPNSRLADEVQFRRGENYFMQKKYRDAENAYQSVVAKGDASEYFEMALFKLGWSFYKQDDYEDALHRYFALIDHKVGKGFDFDAKHAPAEDRRVEDTFQVIALSFSNLGGPDVIDDYFRQYGHRAYEDRAYRYLGEFYLSKQRYQDAATVYKQFVKLYPFHASSPDFSLRIIATFEQGGFPQLVVDAKRDFANNYGLKAEYWQHNDIGKRADVVGALKSNLVDLANFYHARYQEPKLADVKQDSFKEATHWYSEFLDGFHDDAQAPKENYQFADLLRENGDLAGAAVQYERTAYDYPPHAKSADAGYAAIFAHREYLKVVEPAKKEQAVRDTVASSLRFADTFPQHPEAPTVLVAAAEDLYDLKDYTPARDAGRTLIEKFPNAAPKLQRSAWLVVAHASYELADYPNAEQAYVQVLQRTGNDDPDRADLIENLAASVYKQGEAANAAGDYRAAANHFLRIKQVAPTAKIRAGAQYDAGQALIKIPDWLAAAKVLEDFRNDNPQHELAKDATRLIANAYRQAGQLGKAAGEYERVANEAPDPATRAEALLLAGQLYEDGKDVDRALAVYARYVAQFPHPAEGNVEAHQRMAEIHKARNDDAKYRGELQALVQADAGAGGERTARTRTLAGRGALVLAQPSYDQFAQVKLTLPFEKSLADKQKAMKASISAFNALVAYEVPDVTAAATFYLGEIYANFSKSLDDSERPKELSGSDLQDYNDQLDDMSFPYSEKAIGLHEKNIELMQAGVYDEWTEKSLSRLAELKPARYARAEVSSGFVGSADHYEYVQPVPPPPAPAAAASAPVAAANAPAASGDAIPAVADGANKNDANAVSAGASVPAKNGGANAHAQ